MTLRPYDPTSPLHDLTDMLPDLTDMLPDLTDMLPDLTNVLLDHAFESLAFPDPAGVNPGRVPVPVTVHHQVPPKRDVFSHPQARRLTRHRAYGVMHVYSVASVRQGQLCFGADSAATFQAFCDHFMTEVLIWPGPDGHAALHGEAAGVPTLPKGRVYQRLTPGHPGPDFPQGHFRPLSLPALHQATLTTEAGVHVPNPLHALWMNVIAGTVRRVPALTGTPAAWTT